MFEERKARRVLPYYALPFAFIWTDFQALVTLIALQLQKKPQPPAHPVTTNPAQPLVLVFCIHFRPLRLNSSHARIGLFRGASGG